MLLRVGPIAGLCIAASGALSSPSQQAGPVDPHRALAPDEIVVFFGPTNTDLDTLRTDKSPEILRRLADSGPYVLPFDIERDMAYGAEKASLDLWHRVHDGDFGEHRRPGLDGRTGLIPLKGVSVAVLQRDKELAPDGSPTFNGKTFDDLTLADTADLTFGTDVLPIEEGGREITYADFLELKPAERRPFRYCCLRHDDVLVVRTNDGNSRLGLVGFLPLDAANPDEKGERTYGITFRSTKLFGEEVDQGAVANE